MAGVLYIVSAPSGAGKTSLVHALLQADTQMKFSVSYTTRSKREGEQEGVDYHFVSTEQFKQMIAEERFLEYASVFGNYYGSSKELIKNELKNGRDIILEIDWQGAKQIRQSSFRTVSIFILPPSKKALRQRIVDRKKDESSVIEQRLRMAMEEVRHCQEYDYLVVNDHFEDALAQLQVIVQAERLRVDYQSSTHQSLIAELLQAEM